MAEGDGPSGIGFEVLFIILLILANGFFAMYEMAIVSSRKSKLEQLAQQGDGGAKVALDLFENPSKILSSIQIGITLIGIFTGAVGGIGLAKILAEFLRPISWIAPWRESISLVIVVATITYLSLIIGELVPKQLALSNSEKISIKFSKVMNLFSRWMSPFVYFLSVSSEFVLNLLGTDTKNTSVVTEAEIRQLVRESAESGGDVKPGEEKMVQRIFNLGDARVESLMTPRTQIEWVDLDDSLEEVVQQISSSNHSRFPVALDDLDHVKGFFYTRDILGAWKRSAPLGAVEIRPALFVPRSLPVFELFELFQKEGVKEALVLDEYGGLAGLVSMYDILSEMIGELPSEEEGRIFRRADGSWLIDGIVPIADMKEQLGITEMFVGEDEGEYNTVGGWITFLLGHIPEVGEKYHGKTLMAEVVDMDRARVDKILLYQIESVDKVDS